MNSVRVLQIGTGKMAKYTMRYVYEKGGIVVGAVDIDSDLIGKDIGHVMEEADKGVIINDVKDLDNIIKNTNPNIAIIMTRSILNEIEEEVRTCLKNGVNVITTCEEAFYASYSNPGLFSELDSLAKAYQATVVGCGYQDTFWGHMISSICGSTQKITKIKGVSSYNVEDYGIALAEAHGAGMTVEEFNKTIASTNGMSETERNDLMEERRFFPSYMWNVVGWLADNIGLNITTINQECIPVITEEKLESKTLNMTLDEGVVRGMNAIVKAETKEGIVIEIECIGKVYTNDEEDLNDWTIFGEPTTKVFNAIPDTVGLTCANIVNRIPDVIKARSGFVSTSELAHPRYIVNSFDEILK